MKFLIGGTAAVTGAHDRITTIVEVQFFIVLPSFMSSFFCR